MGCRQPTHFRQDGEVEVLQHGALFSAIFSIRKEFTRAGLKLQVSSVVSVVPTNMSEYLWAL